MYIRDSGDFLENIENISTLPENTILVMADVVGLYPSILHQHGLIAHKEALENRSVKKIPTENLIQMAEFVLKNNLFEFNKVFQQIGTKFILLYACINMDRVEQGFLETQELQPLLWLKFIDDIFFIWICGKEELKCTPNILSTQLFSAKH